VPVPLWNIICERDFVLRLSWLAVGAFVFLGWSVSHASPAPNDYALTAKLVPTPAQLQINSSGLSEYDKKSWKIEKQNDGTELYTFISKPEAAAAIIRNSSGDLESMTTYKLSSKGTEESGTLFFEHGSVRSYTTCEDRGEKEIGRVCVTATPDLCHALKASAVHPEEMKQMDGFEMRALAILLTLRGSDHQLDNMAKSGNRLGLKSALQTTKGQLVALARQIQKELTPRTPAVATIAANVPATATADDKIAQSVLERSLPRLKQACLDTHFN
jgi:hypothetical protein